MYIEEHTDRPINILNGLSFEYVYYTGIMEEKWIFDSFVVP